MRLGRLDAEARGRGLPQQPGEILGERLGRDVVGRAKPQPASPDRASLRLAVLCWPADKGWPSTRAPTAANSCEWWLLPVTAAGEPDLSGGAQALEMPPFAFNGAAPDESLFVQPPAPAAAPAPATAKAPAQCGAAARERTATLDRFDQWDLQIRGGRAPSLDRATLTLRASA